MTEHRSSAHIDKESQSDALDQYVAGLLNQHTNSGEFAAMTEAEQGIAIMDRFIGALARKGDIVDSVGQTHNVETTLKVMNKLHDLDNLTKLTRTGGLRNAVFQLAGDERTGQLLAEAYHGALTKDENGNMLLRNKDQIEGYLHSGANNKIIDPVGGVDLPGDQWVRVLEERATMVLERNDQWIFDPYKGIIQSDNDYLRQEGNKWRMAVTSAEKVGADPSLIGRSVEAIGARQRAERQAMGGSALSQTVQKER